MVLHWGILIIFINLFKFLYYSIHYNIIFIYKYKIYNLIIFYSNYMNMNKINDKKCAPGIKYEDGSCFKKKILIDILTEYNKRSGLKINPDNLSKKDLVSKLNEVFLPKCVDQLCWTNQIKLDAIKKEEILKGTFRPFGPEGKYEWLSTSDINDVLEQYQSVHKDFLFLGAVPYDFEELSVLNIGNIKLKELDKLGKTKIGMVINLDEHNQSGSHWVALYCNLHKHQVYFFDSVGNPPRKKIKRFINKLTKYIYKKKYSIDLPINDIKGGDYAHNIHFNNLSKIDIKYNHVKHQTQNSECGVYSVNFIIRLLEGEKFNNIINNITRDEKMNQYRKEIFINVN